MNENKIERVKKKGGKKQYPIPPDLNTRDGQVIYNNDFMHIDLVLQRAIYDFKNDDKKKVEFVNKKLPKVLGLIRRIEEAIDLHYDNNIRKVKSPDDFSEFDNYPEKKRKAWIKIRKKVNRLNKYCTNDHRRVYYELINSDPNWMLDDIKQYK